MGDYRRTVLGAIAERQAARGEQGSGLRGESTGYGITTEQAAAKMRMLLRAARADVGHAPPLSDWQRCMAVPALRELYEEIRELVGDAATRVKVLAREEGILESHDPGPIRTQRVRR